MVGRFDPAETEIDPVTGVRIAGIRIVDVVRIGALISL
jgi:hypothetical protein